MPFVAWSEIESFHNIRKYATTHPEILNDSSVVFYMPKVKLHGTNAGIQIHSDGNVVAQSRTAELINGADNAGFAKWVDSNKEKWAAIFTNFNKEYIIFGEWIGPGIQKGVAINNIPQKAFVVFAARHLDLEDDSLIIEPNELQNLVKDIPDTYVLPWHNHLLKINWADSAEALGERTSIINTWVTEVENNDPWAENTFGIKGTGEGLVFYPVSENHLGVKNFTNLVFKAKGDKHKNIKTAAPAQVDPEVAASIQQFVDMVLTNARLEQGVTNVTPDDICDIKFLGKFLAWIITDVKKETQDELIASQLTWEQVNKYVIEVARNWYINKTKE
jgi:hypothetical protein